MVDDLRVDASPKFEVRFHHPRIPDRVADLLTLGVVCCEESVLFSFLDCSVPIRPEQVAVLADPITAAIEVDEVEAGDGQWVDVTYRPGVTDTEGEMAALALEFAGAVGLRCSSGLRYRFDACVAPEIRGRVERLLGNPLIHRFGWSDSPLLCEAPEIEGASVDPVRSIPLRDQDDLGLDHISSTEGLALDLLEMRAVRDFFEILGRDPTDVEIQSIALAWSEHCSHKTFKATIDFEHNGRVETIDGLLSACIVDPSRALEKPWVRSSFVDNAGIIALDGEFDLAFKVETHNHPTALEPFGGAHTGVGGVIRDVLAVSAEPIANTDVLCFGPVSTGRRNLPEGVIDPKITLREVVRGIAEYGNNMGIPTVAGGVLFHPGYESNPLVYCGTLGIAPRDSHPTKPRPGDLVLLLGGRTGRDGLHGATMSSATLDRATVAGSTVQIGAPMTEKLIAGVLPHLRDERLYDAITDCGAGGLCSAVGEMASGLGVEVDLTLVPLKYQGLTPWEIWLSEAQERMILAVPGANLPRLLELCRLYSVEATVLGRFRDDGTLLLSHDGRLVARMPLGFLESGYPARTLRATWREPSPIEPERAGKDLTESGSADMDPGALILRLLSHPNISTRESVIRRFDHEVQGKTVGKPLVGINGHADAAVLQPRDGSPKGAVLSHGINPLYGACDPYDMAMLAVDEALRNLVAVGGSIDHAALLDNFCWGDVDEPEQLGGLVRAAQGCRDAVDLYQVPFISGKDSLRNTSIDENGSISIPGTLLISALGVVDDVRRCITSDLKSAGSLLYIVGLTAEALAGSHLHLIQGRSGGKMPAVRADTPPAMRRLTEAIRQGLVLSCHDLSEGGLAVAAAEMAIAGGLGLKIDLTSMPAEGLLTDEGLLFSESPGRFLVEVGPERAAEFESLLRPAACRLIGRVTTAGRLIFSSNGAVRISLSLPELGAAWRTPFSPDSPDANSFSSPEPRHESVRVDRGSVKSVIAAAPSHSTRALVLSAPGTNCDAETVRALSLVGAVPELVHLGAILNGRRRWDEFGLIVIPGGFSYGDHLGAGSMLATILRHRCLEDLTVFAASGRPIVGICNGFQVLARIGFLGPVALAPNVQAKFECRWVALRVHPSPCPFFDGLYGMLLPIAHGEGRVVMPDQDLPDRLINAPLRYLDNPNGSAGDIAALTSPAGNVLGMMPHPERYISSLQHPSHDAGKPSGLSFFENVVRYAGRQ